MSTNGWVQHHFAPSNHVRTLQRLSIAATILTWSATIAASFLPMFDTSPLVALPSPAPTGPGERSLGSYVSPSNVAHKAVQSLLRWDTFYFAHSAMRGYKYEHEWAFFPGTPLLTNAALWVYRALTRNDAAPHLTSIMAAGALCAATTHSISTFYELTLHHLRSPTLVLLASLLSLLPSSPVTLRLTPSSEPFFTFCSYKGMLHCAKKQWFYAACWFAAASAFRSNGILLAGYLIWGLVVEPILNSKTARPGYAAVLSALALSPFVCYQYAAYTAFCTTPGVEPREWCARPIPLIYTYVQSAYWNVGFLRYWTPQQAPNFVLAAPVLALLLSSSVRYIALALLPRLQRLTQAYRSLGRQDAAPESRASPFLAPSLAPHAVHTLILSLVLLFASHMQIALRFAASLPFTYWAAAWLMLERPSWGKAWVGWSVVWGALSCVLWTVFLPPA